MSNERYYFDKLFELRLKEKKQTVEGRLNILTYELGHVVKSIYYSLRFPNDKNSHIANAKIELGDLITMIHMLCIDMGWDFDEIRRLGLEHIEERYMEFEENKWSETNKKRN